MSRNLLHKTKKDAFLAWCDRHGYKTRKGKGVFQVAQVYFNLKWEAIYERIHMPEHYTVTRGLEFLVKAFINEGKRNVTVGSRSDDSSSVGKTVG